MNWSKISLSTPKTSFPMTAVFSTNDISRENPMKGTFRHLSYLAQTTLIFHFFPCFFFFLSLYREVGEAPSDTMSEEVDSEVYPSEDGKHYRSITTTLYLPFELFLSWLHMFSSIFGLTFQILCFVRKISAYNCLAVSLTLFSLLFDSLQICFLFFCFF